MSNWSRYNSKSKDGKFLIKFLSEKHLSDFFKTGEIWFSRADKFGDKMECATIDDLKTNPFNFKKLTERKEKHLISCWHNVGRESISMWDTSFKKPEDRRIYALKFPAIEFVNHISICFFSDDLEKVIKEKLMGRVIYKNLLKNTKELEEDRVRRVAFRKEYSFNYEQEFRFVVRGSTPFSKEGYGLKIDNSSNINYSVMVNPLLEKKDYKKYLETLKEHPIGKHKHKNSELVKWLKPTEW